MDTVFTLTAGAANKLYMQYWTIAYGNKKNLNKHSDRFIKSQSYNNNTIIKSYFG